MTYPVAVEDDAQEAAEDPRSAHETLMLFIEAENVAEYIEDHKLSQIGNRVLAEYQVDVDSRRDWTEANKDAMRLAMQITETKTYPWPGAANISFPLLTTASIQFAARAYPAIVPEDMPVKSKVRGADPGGQKRDRGDRVAEHMSWQLTEEMEEWEEDTDKLLHILPITGLCYRKTYYSPNLGRNRSEMVTAERLVVNDAASSLETVPRITHELDPVYPNVFEERVRQGIWRRIELGIAADGGDDDQAPHDFLEQHCLLDLDEDGLQEPWIVTVHKDTGQVVRIAAGFGPDGIMVDEDGQVVRIERTHYFTKYSFLPNPSGGFHTIGFGYLLRPLSEAINSAMNQMLDAGHMQTVGGGFIGSGARLKGGAWRVKPGEYKPVDTSGKSLRENIVPLPAAGPSPVLFQLLGLLIDAAEDITSVKDAMTGEAQGRNQSPTTTLALIEQGMQVFSAIYKRIYRSLKQEYGKLYLLNAEHVTDGVYQTLHDDEKAIAKDDYATGDLDVQPVADPSVVTNMQKLGRAQFMEQYKDDPMFDPKKIRLRIFEAAGIDDVDDLLVEEAPPDPMMLAEADKLDIEKRRLDSDINKAADELDIKKRELELKEKETRSKIALQEAQIEKLLSEGDEVAIKARAGALLEEMRLKRKELDHSIDLKRQLADAQRDLDAEKLASETDMLRKKTDAEIAAKKEKAKVDIEIKRKAAADQSAKDTMAPPTPAPVANPEPVILNVHVGGNETRKFTLDRNAETDRLTGGTVDVVTEQ